MWILHCVIYLFCLITIIAIDIVVIFYNLFWVHRNDSDQSLRMCLVFWCFLIFKSHTLVYVISFCERLSCMIWVERWSYDLRLCSFTLK